MSVLTRRRSVRRRGSGGGGLTTIVSDTFTRADSTSTLGSADTGQAWSVSTAGAVFGINTNQAYQVNGTANAVATVDAGVADCTVQLDVVVSPAGLVWRDDGGSNHFVLVTSSGTVFKKTAGTYASFTSFGAAAQGAGTYKVVLSGSAANVYKNGSLVGTVTSSAYLANTRHGIYVAGDSSVRIDNFTVKA